MSSDAPLIRSLVSRLASPTGAYLGIGGIVAAALALALFGHTLPSAATLGLYALAFVPYAAALGSARVSSVSFRWFIVGAVAARLALLGAEPLLSDDIYRYVWDGRVALAGINPFRYAPASEALAHLRDPHLWPEINHPEVPTIYPPGAQYLFQLNALVGGGVLGMKTLFCAIETMLVVGCWRALRDRFDDGTLRFAFVLYALNPLIVVEVAWSGHLDVVAWGLLALGIATWQTRESLRSAAAATLALGASVAVKFLGLVALPLILFDRGDETTTRPLTQRLAVPLGVVAMLIASYVPVANAGSKLFEGFGTYAEAWRGNDAGFRAVRAISESALESWADDEHRTENGRVLVHLEALDGLYQRLGWTKTWRGRTLPDTTYTAGELASVVGKAAAVGIVGWVLLWCLLAGIRPAEGTALLLLVLYLFAPVVHPWYVAWLAPLVALPHARSLRWPALGFSCTVLLAYTAWVSSRLGGPWHVPTWAVALEYGTVLVLWWLTSAKR